jgi:hypothetical protein
MPSAHARSTATVFPRSSRGKTVLIAIFLAWATPVLAGPMPQAEYAAAMTGLDKIETLIASTVIALQNGMTQSDARAALPHLQDRLQWMRNTKVAAARYDSATTLRHLTPEHQYAQCIIMRAGLMDEMFQDMMVNVSMKARGTGDNNLLEINNEPSEQTLSLYCNHANNKNNH